MSEIKTNKIMILMMNLLNLNHKQVKVLKVLIQNQVSPQKNLILVLVKVQKKHKKVCWSYNSRLLTLTKISITWKKNKTVVVFSINKNKGLLQETRSDQEKDFIVQRVIISITHNPEKVRISK